MNSRIIIGILMLSFVLFGCTVAVKSTTEYTVPEECRKDKECVSRCAKVSKY